VRVLGEAVRLEAVDIGADGSEAEVMKGEFLGAGADLAGGAGVGTSCGGIEAAADVTRGTRILRDKASTRAVETAARKLGGVGERVGGAANGGNGGKLKDPVLPDSSDGGGIQVILT
jgi:hypothetical protein